MELAARVDNYGLPAWIALMVLGFIIFWPVGLAVLVYLIWSGRMGCWKNKRRYDDMVERGRESVRRWKHGGGFASSGNAAFDEYRADTLRRLEDEQKEFMDFLERLRHARDKEEFDQFMADRARRKDDPEAPDGPGDPAPQPAA